MTVGGGGHISGSDFDVTMDASNKNFDFSGVL